MGKRGVAIEPEQQERGPAADQRDLGIFLAQAGSVSCLQL
jgi:hypothetical protein